ESSTGQLVGPDAMQVLRVKPILGRTFLPEDFSQRDAADTVVLSRSYWRQRFGGDSNIVGQVVRWRSYSFTIIGVVPDFHVLPWIGKLDYWQAIDVSRRADERRFQFIGRLKPGVSIEQAEAELEGIRRGLDSSEPGLVAAPGVKVQPLDEYVAGRYSEALYLLFGAVGFVLLIGCVNLANLMLGRASDREKEIATRVALGAGRGRLIRQLLTESVLLSVVGGGLGVVLALWGVHLFVALSPDFYPAEEIRIDGMVLGFALVTSVLTGLLVGT
ncbi:MAG: FtsX-like permease family protein, partial [bacterium]|nr:FtsX-like permease family protein [bacterium]